MKRLNPSTGKPFVRGDTRADGFLFLSYQTNIIKKDGYFKENWVNETSYEWTRKLQKDWYSLNSKHVKQYSAKWAKNNKDKKNASWSKRNAIKLKATPQWLTEEHYIQIESVYTQAKQLTEQTGIPHEVDHIIPLRSKLVCGLHVPWNLEVKTAEANRKKGNSFQIHE